MDQKVILLFGGESEERLVSVASAQAMAQAINVAKLWFWHKEGKVFEIDYSFLSQHKEPFTNELIPNCKPLYQSINEAVASKSADNHVFLLGVHGGSGENGYLQSLLEQAKRPFTGSGAKASKLAFDKIATKEWLKSYNIRMAPHVVIVPRDTNTKETLLGFFASVGNIVVKPVCGGSSIGCTFVKSKADIDSVIEKVAELPAQIFLAEKMIVGREITVGVFEGPEGPVGLPCTEIVLDHNRDFDYLGKYLGVGTKEVTPAPLPPSLTREAQRMAVAAHAALALDGYSRTDLILADEGFYFLETNTLPGLTKQSLVPQQLAAFGITMREFLASQIDLATSRKF